MSVHELQEALPRWVRIERPAGTAEVTERQVGGINVTEVMGYPEASKDAERGTFAEVAPDAVRINLHFVEIAPTAEFPDREELIAVVRAALGPGEFTTMWAEDLAGGPSYITLGGWLGSQDLALMLIGAVELAGISPAITPTMLGMDDEMANVMAGNGFIMLGPFPRWAE